MILPVSWSRCPTIAVGIAALPFGFFVFPYRPLPRLERTPRTAVVIGSRPSWATTTRIPTLVEVEVEVDDGAGHRRRACLAGVIAEESLTWFTPGGRWQVHSFE